MLNKLVCIGNVFMNISPALALLLVLSIPARCNIFQKIQHGTNINQLSLHFTLRRMLVSIIKWPFVKNLFEI